MIISLYYSNNINTKDDTFHEKHLPYFIIGAVIGYISSTIFTNIASNTSPKENDMTMSKTIINQKSVEVKEDKRLNLKPCTKLTNKDLSQESIEKPNHLINPSNTLSINPTENQKLTQQIQQV